MALWIDNNEVLTLIIDDILIESVTLAGVVVAQKPTITTQPTGGSINVEQTKILSVVADGLGSTINYQWYNNDVLISGAIYPDYTFSPSSAGTFGFICNVAGFGGITVSSLVSVVVEEAASTHHWTIGSDVGVLFNTYGYLNDASSGGSILGDFQPRQIIGGFTSVALMTIEGSEKGDNNYNAYMYIDGNYEGDMTLDISEYGMISGRTEYDPVIMVSFLLIWIKTPSDENRGAQGGEGFHEFCKLHQGQTIQVKVYFKPD